eukprot:scaffold326985_cov57-Tisochrysis_lutea.AAC.2
MPVANVCRAQVFTASSYDRTATGSAHEAPGIPKARTPRAATDVRNLGFSQVPGSGKLNFFAVAISPLFNCNRQSAQGTPTANTWVARDDALHGDAHPSQSIGIPCSMAALCLIHLGCPPSPFPCNLAMRGPAV